MEEMEACEGQTITPSLSHSLLSYRNVPSRLVVLFFLHVVFNQPPSKLLQSIQKDDECSAGFTGFSCSGNRWEVDVIADFLSSYVSLFLLLWLLLLAL